MVTGEMAIPVGGEAREERAGSLGRCDPSGILGEEEEARVTGEHLRVRAPCRTASQFVEQKKRVKMLAAIRSNNVEKMRRCRGQMKAWPPHQRHCCAYVEEAIKLGHLDALQWLYWQLKERGGQSLAIEHDQRAILEWLMNHDQAYCGDHLLSMAIEKGDVELLEWLHARGCQPRDSALHAAVVANRVDLLEWLKARGCAIGTEHNLAVPPMNAAARAGSLDSLVWLRANGVEWGQGTMACAFKWLQPRILQHLHEQGCPWSAGIWSVHRPYMKQLVDCSYGRESIDLTGEEHERFFACLRYLLEHRCPCSCRMLRTILVRCVVHTVLLPKWRAVVRWMIKVRPYLVAPVLSHISQDEAVLFEILLRLHQEFEEV